MQIPLAAPTDGFLLVTNVKAVRTKKISLLCAWTCDYIFCLHSVVIISVDRHEMVGRLRGFSVHTEEFFTAEPTCEHCRVMFVLPDLHQPNLIKPEGVKQVESSI